MSGIKGQNTKPELIIRRALHARGFRYRLHAADFPGKPDMLFPRYRAAVFVHGCFWHGHDCKLFKVPSTRVEFWLAKIAANRTRDAEVARQTAQRDWRHLVIWECAIRGSDSIGLDQTVEKTRAWLQSDRDVCEIRSVTAERAAP